MRIENGRINEVIDFSDSGKNWKFPFEKMSRFYGKDFIVILKAMWSVNDGVQTEDEFCEMNGIPRKFFDKTINV